MIEVQGVHRYPLTGARAEGLTAAAVNPSGIEGDRNLVLYDSTASIGSNPRVSQLQLRGLARVAATYTQRAGEYYLPNYGNFYVSHDTQDSEVIVTEFDDAVPCYDVGEFHAKRLSRELGREGIRLARKSDEWLAGGVVAPSERSNRPVHIVNAATVRELQSRARAMGVGNAFSADRFRPNIVIDGDCSPFEENEWQGERIIIGGVPYFIQGPTPRCPVPGNDQQTGKSMKDVPKLYKGLPQNQNGKPLVGVYAYPVLELGDRAEIAVGMSVAA